MRNRVMSIARKGRGIGGMQRLQADIDHALSSSGDIDLSVIRPWFSWDVTFPFRAIAKAMRRFEVIHLGDSALSFLIPFLRFRNARIVVTACGLDVVYRAFWYQWILRRTLWRADHVICISNATASEVGQRGVPPHTISVIPCGIWKEKNSWGRNQPSSLGGLRPAGVPAPQYPGKYLLFIGRLIPRKGIAWFLEHVFAKLHAEDRALMLMIAGDGPEKARLIALRDRLGLQTAVSIVGHLSEAEKQKLLAGASLFVMPNIPVEGDMEGFGIVCIEASGHGTPVLASRLEGISDAVIDGRTGKFFEPLNADDAIRKAKTMLRATWDRSAVRERTLEKYAWPRLVLLYRDVFFPKHV